jgi:hypothetical protein
MTKLEIDKMMRKGREARAQLEKGEPLWLKILGGLAFTIVMASIMIIPSTNTNTNTIDCKNIKPSSNIPQYVRDACYAKANNVNHKK